ncbi:MAG: family 10 glycosylhydrolase, partial [Longimicrobiales bacterium]|nr:family 10 glycosylhydrolase [Longimicrobiales bacterium]
MTRPFSLASRVVLALAFLLQGCSMVEEPMAAPAPTAQEPRPSRPSTPRLEQPERPAVGPVAGYRAIPVPSELRALWVVRTTLTHPDSIRAMVDRAANAGFNTLLVQVRGRGDAYYRSRWEPKPESVLKQGTAFDPLGLVIQEAHARGLGVHAWVNGHLVGGNGSLPTDPTHLIRTRPDLLAVPRELARELYDVDPGVPRYSEALLRYAQQNTDRIEGLYTAPSHPEVKEHLYSVWMDLVES